MAAPTPTMQYLLELTNRARMDPQGEYARLTTYAPKNVADALTYFKVNLAVLKQQFDALTASAPLTWNENLAAAATGHSQAMINADSQSHQLPGEPALGTRLANAGYNYSAGGENIYAFAEDAFYAHAGFFIDWGFTTTGIQDGAGHRVNIMNSRFTEMGIGYLYDNNAATAVGTDVITQNFGNRRDFSPLLTGVVIQDKDGDKFYDVGEGIGGVSVTAVGSTGTYSTTTWGAGGYNLAAPAGAYQITFSYNGRSWTTSATLGATNVKVDADLANMVGIISGGNFVGGAGNDTVRVSGGGSFIDGGAGLDWVYILDAASKPGFKATVSSNNAVVITNGDGVTTNSMINVERVGFFDGSTVAFDFEGNAGQAYRIYQAAFHRTPDKGGLGFWIKELDAGHGDLLWVARNFIGSKEFKDTYGSAETVTDKAFLTLLYSNVLGRNPDDGGLAYWGGEIGRGMGRDKVLASFSESAENKAGVAAAIHDGIWYI